MSEPRHISECINEWLDDYERQHMDPFNLPDALTAIRDEMVCAERGHFTVAPTGAPMPCLRCGLMLDGLGLDPRFAPTRTTAREPETKHQPHDAAAVVAGDTEKESA